MSALESCDSEFGNNAGVKGQGGGAEGPGELSAQGMCRSTFVPQGQGQVWARDAAGVELWPPLRGRQLLPLVSGNSPSSAPERCGSPGGGNRAEPSLRSQSSGWHGVCGDGRGGPGVHPDCRNTPCSGGQRWSLPSSALLMARCRTTAPRASRMVATGRVAETWPAWLSDCTFNQCRDISV